MTIVAISGKEMDGSSLRLSNSNIIANTQHSGEKVEPVPVGTVGVTIERR